MISNELKSFIAPGYEDDWDAMSDAGFDDDEIWRSLDEHMSFMVDVGVLFKEHAKKFFELSGIPEGWFDYDDNMLLSIGVVDGLSEFTDGAGRQLYRLGNIIMENENNPFYIENDRIRAFAQDYVPHSMKYFQKQHETFTEYDEWDTDTKHEFDIYIQQTTVMEDSFNGYMCLPLKDGRYWLVYYEC